MSGTVERLGIKDMKLSINIIKLWLFGLIVFGSICATSIENKECVFASLILVSIIAVAALYGAVMCDLHCEDTKVFRTIRMIIGLITSVCTLAWMHYSGINSAHLTVGYMCESVCVTVFITYIVSVGSSAFLCISYCMCDHKIDYL